MRRVLDLFCGAAGGWSLGLHRAGWATVAAAESDPWRRSVFAARWPGAVMYGDVRDVDAARLRADLGALPDVVVGSPPCQDISAANSRGQGLGGDRSGLFWEWLRIVGEVRPDWALAENSPRFRALGADDILAGLEALGYAAWPLVVGADDAGAPHIRKRMWIVARRRGDAPDADGDGRRLARGRRLGGDLSDSKDDRGRDAVAADPEGAGLRHAEVTDDRPRASEPVDAVAGVDACQRGDDPDPGGQAGPAIRRRIERAAAGAHAPDPDHREGQHGRAVDGEVGGRGDRAPPDAAGARHPIRSREPGDDGGELPPALRDVGRAWPDWNGGPSGLAAACAAARPGGMDDGLSAGLAPADVNRCIAALGDAVVPQIPEALARAIDAVEGGLMP